MNGSNLWRSFFQNHMRIRSTLCRYLHKRACLECQLIAVPSEQECIGNSSNIATEKSTNKSTEHRQYHQSPSRPIGKHFGTQYCHTKENRTSNQKQTTYKQNDG